MKYFRYVYQGETVTAGAKDRAGADSAFLHVYNKVTGKKDVDWSEVEVTELEHRPKLGR